MRLTEFGLVSASLLGCMVTGMAACRDGTSTSAQGQSGDASQSSSAGADAAATSSTAHHNCSAPYEADPRDETMSGEPVKLDNGTVGQYDLQVPAEIRAWIEEQHWIREHLNWHSTRRCKGSADGGATPGAGIPSGGQAGADGGASDGGASDGLLPPSVSNGGGAGSTGVSSQGPVSAATLAERGLTCAPIQEGDPGDGYAFLVMHRHMIQGLQQAFPHHFSAIRGFSHVPLTQSDTENPFPWKDITWTNAQLEAIDFLEQVEKHLDAFASEDDLGAWIQFGVQYGAGGGKTPTTAVHLALHAQFAVQNSPFSLLDNNGNVLLVPFWRLHGWIDNIWTRYRTAKGIADDDAAYTAELFAQCEGMHALDDTATLNVDAGATDSSTLEVGVFATTVAPLFKTYCTGCHNSSTADEGLTLTGSDVSSSAIRAGLVGVRSKESNLSLVEPGSPDASWLLKKIKGDFTGIDCNACKTTMPLAGGKPSASEIDAITSWIASGATAD